MKKFLPFTIFTLLIITLIGCEDPVCGPENCDEPECQECEICQQAPVIPDQSFSVAEYSPNGTSVGFVQASADSGFSLSYFFITNESEDIFSLNQNTGEIKVIDSSQLDYSIQSSYQFTVVVIQSNENDFSSTANISIKVSPIIPKKGLVAYYPMDGNINDMSGNNNNGIIYGVTTGINRNNENGKALYFDGINDSVLLNDDFDLPEKTINCWVKIENKLNTDDIMMIFSVDNDNLTYGSYYLSFVEPDSIGIKSINAGHTRTQISNPYNAWHMLTYMIDVDSMYLYVDGSLFISNKFTTDRCTTYPNPVMTIGIDRGHNRQYHGTIDEFRIYNRVLAPYEINALYNE